MRKSNLSLETPAEVRERGKSRRIVLEFNPREGYLIHVRLKGCRTRFDVSIRDIYHLAARRAADEQIRAKREARRLKRAKA